MSDSQSSSDSDGTPSSPEEFIYSEYPSTGHPRRPFDEALGSRRDRADKELPGRALGIPPWRIVEGESTEASHLEISDDHDLNEPLRLLQGALRLSSHVLGRDPSQFASQMVGRLLPHAEQASIQRFMVSLTLRADFPWLRPLQPTLHPPGTGLLRTLVGHSSVVNGVAVSPDGRRVVSASYDQTLKVWDLETGQELRTLAGHSDSVNAVAVCPDGRRAVSASDDKTLKVWDLETGQELRTLTGHSNLVKGVAVSPDGRRVVSASYDQTLKVWDLETGGELHTLAGHFDLVEGVAVSPDGRRAISASEDHTLKVWNLETGQELRTLAGHSDSVLGVVVSPDGQRAVSASRDNTLKVWDMEAGQELRTLAGHTDEVCGVAVTPDGRRAVSASADKTLKVWDLEAGVSIATFTCDSNAQCCAFVDDRVIVAGDQEGRVHFLSLELATTESSVRQVVASLTVSPFRRD